MSGLRVGLITAVLFQPALYFIAIMMTGLGLAAVGFAGAEQSRAFFINGRADVSHRPGV